MQEPNDAKERLEIVFGTDNLQEIYNQMKKYNKNFIEKTLVPIKEEIAQGISEDFLKQNAKNLAKI